MASEPRFALRRLGPEVIVLEMDSARWEGEQDLTEIGDKRVKKLAILGEADRVEGVKIMLHHPVEGARAFWWEAEDKLVLDLRVADDASERDSSAAAREFPARTVIEGVRLGTHKHFTRLVFHLSEKTAYHLRWKSPQELTLLVESSGLSPGVSLSTLRDCRILGMDATGAGQEGVAFHMVLADPAALVRPFWWESAKRLVLDIHADLSGGKREEHVQVSPAPTATESTERREQDRPGVGTGTSETAAEAEASDAEGRTEEFEAAVGTTPEGALEGALPSLHAEAAREIRAILTASRSLQTGTALEMVERYTDTHQGQVPESLLFLRGDLYTQRGLQGAPEGFARAVDAYRTALVQCEQSALQGWALLQLGRIHFLEGRFLEAMGYLDLVISKYPDSPLCAQALVFRGRVFIEKDRADLASEEFQQVIRRYPKSPSREAAELGEAICLTIRGYQQRADRLFLALEERNPGCHLTHPELLFYRARNHLALGRFATARRMFFKALNVGGQPEDRSLVLAHIADSYRLEGMSRQAAQFYELIVTRFPESEGAMVSRARVAEIRGTPEPLEEIVRQEPDSEMAGFALVQVAAMSYEQGNYRHALKALRTLGERHPTASLRREGQRLLRRTVEKRVQQLMQQEDYWQVLALLETVKANLSRSYQLKAAIWGAEAYGALGLWDNAARLLGAVGPEELNGAERLHWSLLLARAYESSGQEELAESVLRRSAENTAGGADAEAIAWRLAKLYERGGNHEQALGEYRSLLDRGLTGLSRARALVAVGDSLMDLGEYDKARAAYERALAIRLDGAKAQQWRFLALSGVGDSHYQQGNYRSAARAYENALQSGQLEGRMRRLRTTSRLASCCEKADNYTEAERLYRGLAKGGDDLWDLVAPLGRRTGELRATVEDALSG
jgi:tetratricopeptide (TPR) repeat protein